MKYEYCISHQGADGYDLMICDNECDDQYTIARDVEYERAVEIMHEHAQRNKFKEYVLGRKTYKVLV